MMLYKSFELPFNCSVLKSIEFSPGSPSDEVDGGPDKTKSLEMLLLEKNKALQSENTQLKVNSSDLSGKSHVIDILIQYSR